MKLYFSPGACSLAANIALHEAGIEFTPVKVDLKTKKTADGRDFWTVNPKGYVPALELDDGSLLTENVAVLQYIADRKPAAELAPEAGTMARYRLQEWLGFINSEIHKGFGPFFNPAASEDWKNSAHEKLVQRFKWLDETLGNKSFLMGEHFTVADAYLFTISRWSKLANLDLNEWPALKRYKDRIRERPGVVAAMQVEGLDRSNKK